MHTFFLFTTIFLALPMVLPMVLCLSSLFLLRGYAAQIKPSVKKVKVSTCTFVICALTIACFVFNPFIMHKSADIIYGLLSDLLFIFSAAIVLFIIFVTPRFLLAHPVIINVLLSIQIMSTVFCFWSIGFNSELIFTNYESSYFPMSTGHPAGLILHKLYTSFLYSIPSLITVMLLFLTSVFILKHLTKHAVLISKIFGFILLIYCLTLYFASEID